MSVTKMARSGACWLGVGLAAALTAGCAVSTEPQDPAPSVESTENTPPSTPITTPEKSTGTATGLGVVTVTNESHDCSDPQPQPWKPPTPNYAGGALGSTSSGVGSDDPGHIPR